MKFARITLSDRASAGLYEDRSGPAIEQFFAEHVTDEIEWQRVLIPDERTQIESALRRLSDEEKYALVVTTGGTGPSPRDVTPEATRAVCYKLIEGIPEKMRADGLANTPFAILSRGVCGVRGRSLILNLPGSPKGAVDSLQSVIDMLPHAIDLLAGKTSHGDVESP